MGIEGALWAAPASDIIGIIISIILIIVFFRKLSKIKANENIKDATIKTSKEGVIITIAREHGSQGKSIGELVAKRLNIPYYYKEMTAIAAQESGLDKEFISKMNQTSNAMHELFLASTPAKYAIEAQDRVIKQIAEKGSCVIVGRAADYVLRDNENVVRIFIYAPKEYRKRRVMEMYNDKESEAIKNIDKSDKNRASYYKIISGKAWGQVENYDLCIDSSIGKEKTAGMICNYIENM